MLRHFSASGEGVRCSPRSPWYALLRTEERSTKHLLLREEESLVSFPLCLLLKVFISTGDRVSARAWFASPLPLPEKQHHFLFSSKNGGRKSVSAAGFKAVQCEDHTAPAHMARHCQPRGLPTQLTANRTTQQFDRHHFHS